ncbi:Cytochrome P450 4c3-like protein, partial [Leptotrombidium deliense]
PYDRMRKLFRRISADDFTSNENDKPYYLMKQMKQLSKIDSQFSDEHKLYDFSVLLSAGYETSSFAIITALYYLGNNEEIQEKARNEVNMILNDKENDIMDYEDILKLKYLECILNESMRLQPPIPGFGYEAETDISIDGYKFSKGTQILFPLHVIHMNEEYFPNPSAFNPDRFFNQNLCEFDGAFMPFGKGSRTCIGSRLAMIVMKHILAKILYYYSWRHEGNKDDFRVEVTIGATVKSPVNLTFLRLPKNKNNDYK